jgi:NADH-quinone oxidoreductase subunit J
MTPDYIIFIGLGVIAITSALGMLFSKNAIYSALFLIINFGTIAIFYLILDAPFIALTQVTVYAGAIMVLFLFVIMLLGAEQTGRTPAVWWLQPLALILGAALLLEMVYIVVSHQVDLPGMAQALPSFGGPLEVGQVLFNEYLLPFEVTSILLLAAMIGAIVLTKRKLR